MAGEEARIWASHYRGPYWPLCGLAAEFSGRPDVEEHGPITDVALGGQNANYLFIFRRVTRKMEKREIVTKVVSRIGHHEYVVGMGR